MMKRHAFLLGPIVVAAFATVTSTGRANTIGTNSQLFNPASSSSEFVTVQSSDVIERRWFSFGLFFNHATNPLPYKQTDSQTRTHTNDSITGMDAFLGYGVLPKTEIGIVFPFVIDQKVNEDDTRGEFEQKGNTEVRALLKHNFYKAKGLGLSAVISGNMNRTSEDPYTGAETSPSYNFELAGDLKLGKVTLGSNLGYRYRKQGEKIDGSLTDAIGSQYMMSLGGSYRIHSKLNFVSEVYGGTVANHIANETDRSTTSAEMLTGLRYKAAAHTWVHGGAGTELVHGLGTADWRAYLGVVTEMGPGKSPGRTVVRKKRKAKPVPTFAPEEDIPTDIPTREPDEVFVLHNINFEFDSDFRVLPGAVAELQKLSSHLEGRTFEKIVVEGHTDYFGTDEYNDDLSMRRAKTVRRKLIKYYGFEADKLTPVGYGERVPFTDDMSDAGRQLNRRVEIKVYYMDAH